jgi:CheY-like chemotaxis protein
LYTLRIELNQKQKTFLVVEDNEGVIELYRRYLTDQPISIISSTGSLDGLRMANELLPDLILLDVMMQGLDGWEFLQRIKLNPRTNYIPVIICSVFNEPELAKSLGAAGFLPKPVTQQNLFTLLRQIAIL